ncbi:MAG: hypothetical protein Q7R60_02770 [bacterium]|nr:hypothetical protein [bacterium]
MTTELYPELPQGDAPTYEEVLEEELEMARAQLGPGASLEQLGKLAEKIAEQKRLFERTYGSQE